MKFVGPINKNERDFFAIGDVREAQEMIASLANTTSPLMSKVITLQKVHEAYGDWPSPTWSTASQFDMTPLEAG